ncbi:ATPase [Salinicola endophyticus]|uniref:ATPase n=1 Tax=Salinicola endophyticus TaxID=1949083 RepID=A0ABY8FNH7_9GAMM|nr:AAA family ATPase [Salinicola endophyticus]WFF42756.1 ATPase [Salinicola endophyticus]
MTRPSATTTLTLFGQFGLRQDATTLTQFSYDKVKALLVYLLLQHGPVSRAQLAALLWPDQSLKSARTNLRHALHSLRHALGECGAASLTVTRQTIACVPPTSVAWDLREIERELALAPDVARLEKLLNDYRGELVAELALPQCQAFSHWLTQARGDWRDRVIDYAERTLTKVRTLPEALLRVLVTRFPEHAAFQEQLIRCLAGHGQVAAARECFHSLLRQLALSGEQPSAGFLQFAGDWSDAIPAAERAVPPPAPAAPMAGYSAAEIDFRQVAIMAIALKPPESGNDIGQALACLTLQDQLFRWLETQCHQLGGFWQAAVGSGVGLACFATHGPTHQLAELVALYDHCQQGLSAQVAACWEGSAPPPAFTLCAGLDSGRVIWLPERRTIDPLGDVTQVALAMLAMAEPGELMISLNASQHLPPAFDLQARLTPRLLSADGRVARRALALASGDGGRVARVPSLLGRDAELRQLRDALARVALGLRQSLLVLGDTGIGKSALMIRFRECLQHEDVALFWRQTTRLSSQTPYAVVQSLLRWHLGAEPALASLEALIDATPTLAKIGVERRRLLLDVLVREVTSREAAEEAVELVSHLTQSLILRLTATRRPLVMIIDDLQWLDEPSLKVLYNLQVRLPIHSSLLLLASHQNREMPSIRLNWDQQIALGRLGAEQSAEMLDVLARRHCLTLDPSLREQLIARCEGVPLYLQEICRWLEIDRREGRTLDAAALPRGLLGLLASRIDQLHQDRSVAHMAAVCGRQFETALLRACLDTTDAALRAALEQMRRLEIIEPCEAAPFDFQFTHPLLHEAAYLSCPQDVRVTLHGRLVALIESQRPAWIGRHPGDFAEHLQRSGDPGRGARYFEMAARGALRASANRTALRLAEAGLGCLARGVGGAAERRISLLTVQGQAYYALEGHGSRPAHACFIEAQQLWRDGPAQEEGAEDQAFLVTWGLWVGASQRYANRDADALAEHLRELAQRIDDPRYCRLALYARAYGEYWSGQVGRAFEHLEQIDPLHQPMVLEWLPYSDHPQVAASCYQSWALCLRGDYRRAEQQMEASIRLAESIRHPASLAMALIFAASLYRQLGHVHLALERGQRAFEMTRSRDLQRWHLEALCVLGWGQALAGDTAGLDQVEAGVERLIELTGRARHQRASLWYGDACLALDQLERAAHYLLPCLEQARDNRSTMLPQLLLQMARIQHRQGRPLAEIEALIAEARTWAEEASCAHLELHSLALWLTLVNPDDAESQQALRYRLGEVALSDAPVLIRWRTLLDNLSAEARPPQRPRRGRRTASVRARHG